MRRIPITFLFLAWVVSPMTSVSEGEEIHIQPGNGHFYELFYTPEPEGQQAPKFHLRGTITKVQQLRNPRSHTWFFLIIATEKTNIEAFRKKKEVWLLIDRWRGGVNKMENPFRAQQEIHLSISEMKLERGLLMGKFELKENEKDATE